MASVKAVLQKAAEIAAVVELKSDELVAFSTWGCLRDIQFHLKPFALARVFRDLRTPKHRLKVTWSEAGDLHLTFSARGATWTTLVLRKDFRPGEWQDLIGGEPKRISQVPLALTYAAEGG